MYLRTLLYALRQGVALDSGGRTAPTRAVHDGARASSAGGAVASPESVAGKVPDRLLDLYLSSQDSISLTSKVLDVYAAYVDEGEVSRAKQRLLRAWSQSRLLRRLYAIPALSPHTRSHPSSFRRA